MKTNAFVSALAMMAATGSAKSVIAEGAPSRCDAAMEAIFAPALSDAVIDDTATSASVRAGVVYLDRTYPTARLKGFLAARGLYVAEGRAGAIDASARAWLRNAECGWPTGIVRVNRLVADWPTQWDALFDAVGPLDTVASVDLEDASGVEMRRLARWLQRYRYRLSAVVIGSGFSSPYDTKKFGEKREEAVARVGKSYAVAKSVLPDIPAGVTVDCGLDLAEWARTIGWRPDFVAVLGAYCLEADLDAVIRRARARFGTTPPIWSGVTSQAREDSSCETFESDLPAAVERARRSGFSGVFVFVP